MTKLTEYFNLGKGGGGFLRAESLRSNLFAWGDFCSCNISPASQPRPLDAGTSPLCASTLLTSLCVASFFSPWIKYSCSGVLLFILVDCSKF